MALTLKLALLQSSLIWHDPQGNRRNFNSRIAQVDSDTALIVLPEMFSTGFTMAPGEIAVAESRKTLDWLCDLAVKRQMAITGSVAYAGENQYTNRLFFVYPSGDYRYYDKRHTFTLAGEHEVYGAGKEKLILEYHGFNICPMICYDLRFPVWSRNTENFDVLLYVANWPAPRIVAWDTLLRARAIENMAYCMGVNRVGKDQNGHTYPGHSAIYDCLGNQMVYSEEETILSATLSRAHITENREKLRFLEDRDAFTLIG